jgi:hypothetical protein
VELVRDRGGLGASPHDADAPGEVAAQVGDQRDQVTAWRDVDRAPSPGGQPGRGLGNSDDDEEVHSPTLPASHRTVTAVTSRRW